LPFLLDGLAERDASTGPEMTKIRLRYQTLQFGDIDIHLCTLRDRQQFHDPDGVAEGLGISSASWPIFGVVWPSGLALADFMDGYDTGTKRILEVGCGTALPSLLLKLKGADITATDCHPEVAAFLARNTTINEGADIAFERTDWADKDDHLGDFDLIIGSDLLYEDEHTELLANFIDAHAKLTCEVILVDPGRGRKSKLTTAMEKFGYSCSYQQLPNPTESGREFAGHILKFER
jgi:predicted nicotinamide N-methyase